MAYFTPRAKSKWELRESIMTTAGPRSRTLATFRVLSSQIIEHACRRSTKALDPTELKEIAVRAGVPVALSPVDKAARDLYVELRAKREPSPILRRLLVDELSDVDEGIPDEVCDAAMWIGATLEKRSSALCDLLLLADKLPSKKSVDQRFPRFKSVDR